MKPDRAGLLVIALSLAVCGEAAADTKWDALYSDAVLTQQQPRFERKTRELYGILGSLLSPAERKAFAGVAFDHPLRSGSPLNFFVRPTSGGPRVTLPVQSLLFVEELSTAYAWLQSQDYSLETIDEYITMLTFKQAGDFPEKRLPPPLTALGIPSNATAKPAVDGLSLRLRNSAYAFILGHELGHVSLGHRGYSGITMERARTDEAAADRFALDLLQRASTIPMGAILFFQAQAYATPNRGQFQAAGLSAKDWEGEVQSALTHPLTADRLSAIAVEIETSAARWPRPSERPILRFIAENLAVIAGYLQDADLQQCVAVAATRTNTADLRPRKRGEARAFLEKCVKK
jgi:hypothetical protein